MACLASIEDPTAVGCHHHHQRIDSSSSAAERYARWTHNNNVRRVSTKKVIDADDPPNQSCVTKNPPNTTRGRHNKNQREITDRGAPQELVVRCDKKTLSSSSVWLTFVVNSLFTHSYFYTCSLSTITACLLYIISAFEYFAHHRVDYLNSLHPSSNTPYACDAGRIVHVCRVWSER